MTAGREGLRALSFRGERKAKGQFSPREKGTRKVTR